MAYKVKPIYGSTAQGKKPIKFAVVDSDDIVKETFLYKADAERERDKLNKAKGSGRHFTSI